MRKLENEKIRELGNVGISKLEKLLEFIVFLLSLRSVKHH